MQITIEKGFRKILIERISWEKETAYRMWDSLYESEAPVIRKKNVVMRVFEEML